MAVEGAEIAERRTEETLTARIVEEQRGERKSTKRICGVGSREPETAAGLWKIVNRLNSSAQPRYQAARNYLISPIIFARVHFSCHYRDVVPGAFYDFTSRDSLWSPAVIAMKSSARGWRSSARARFEKWFSFRLSPRAFCLTFTFPRPRDVVSLTSDFYWKKIFHRRNGRGFPLPFLLLLGQSISFI